MGVTREWGSLNLDALPKVPRVVKYGLAPAWEHDFQLPRDFTGGMEDTRPGTAHFCREESGSFSGPPPPAGGGLGGGYDMICK